MNIMEVARVDAPKAAPNSRGDVARVCIVSASGQGTALGKEFVATDNDAPFSSVDAANDAITYGIRQPDGALASPWRGLHSSECEFFHPTRHVAAMVPVADLYALESLLVAMQTAPHRGLAFARGALKVATGHSDAILAIPRGAESPLDIFSGRSISAKQHENFEDGASRLILLDLDGLHEPSLDLANASSGDVDDAVRAVVDRIPTLAGASFLFQPTSSFGLIDAHKLSGRLAFIADRPITLEDEQVLTDQLNREAGHALFDTSICAVGHLVYAALPALYADVAALGRVRCSPDPKRLDELLARVVEGHRDTIVVPALDAQMLSDVRSVRAAAARRSDGTQGNGWDGKRQTRPLAWQRDIAPLLSEISSTGAHNHVLRALFQIALRAPSFKFRSLLLRLASEARARITETSSGGDLKRRLGYVEMGRLEQELGTALAKAGRRKRRNSLPQVSRPISLQEGRRAVAHALDDAVNANGNELDEWRRARAKAIRTDREVPSRPFLPVTVIQAPPGLGKTHASNETQDSHRAAASHMLHLCPTIELAKQKERDYQARWGKKNSRRIQSRAELCLDPDEWGKKCEEVERHGQSPKPICTLCPHKDACPATTRVRDFTDGLTIGTHPQAEILFGDQWLGRGAIHDKHKQQPDHVFWDETAAPLLLGEPLRCDLGAASLDTGARREIAAVIKSSKRPEIETCSLAPRGIVGWACAAHAERERRESAETSIVNLVAAMAATKPTRGDQAGRNKRDADTAKLAHAREQHNEAAFFETACRAILRALSDGRQFVFGLDAHGSAGIAQLPKQLPKLIRQSGLYVLDATSVPALDRALLGADTVVRTVPPVKAGAVHLVQFCDRSYGQSYFPETGSTGRAKRRDSNIARLHALIRHEAALLFAEQRQHSCVVDGRKIDLAVMCQPAVRKQLLELGLPETVHVTTHRLARGLNFAEQAPCVISVGRTMPRQEELLRQARVIAAGLPASDDDLLLTLDAAGYEPALLPCADGLGVEVKKRRHLHPLVRALVEHYESDVMQSAFRGRPLSRTADNPLRLIVLANVATGLPIDEPLEWLDATRSELDIQQALGLVFERALVPKPPDDKFALPRNSSFRRARYFPYMSYFAGDVFFDDCDGAPAKTSRRAAEITAKELWSEHVAALAGDPRWRTGRCRVAGHRYQQRISIDTERHADPKEALQRLMSSGAVWIGWEDETPRARRRGRPRRA